MRMAPLSPSRKRQFPVLPLARTVQRIVSLFAVYLLECLTFGIREDISCPRQDALPGTMDTRKKNKKEKNRSLVYSA
jgi:hypothetical protein